MTKAEEILAANNYHPSNLLESDRDALLKSMDENYARGVSDGIAIVVCLVMLAAFIILFVEKFF